MERMTKSSMMKRRTIAQNRPLLLTVTGVKLLTTAYRSHGRGRLLRNRKINLKRCGSPEGSTRNFLETIQNTTKGFLHKVRQKEFQLF